MKKLKYELISLLKHNKDGSHSTHANRKRILSQIADDIAALGFKISQMSANDFIRGKDVNRLVEHWKSQNLTTGTIKNRMSALRWWAERVDKAHVLPDRNFVLGIGNRKYVTNTDKSVRLTADQLASIKNTHVQYSVKLQEAFGLRREEALKIQVHQADKGDRLHLSPSWCKGGRARSVPIQTAEQRRLLDEVRGLVGKGSLIPADRSYRQQMESYKAALTDLGVRGHGLRHAYAQDRYAQLTGFAAPAAGGAGWRDLSADQKAADLSARKIITEELGHSRLDVTSVYLGK